MLLMQFSSAQILKENIEFEIDEKGTVTIYPHLDYWAYDIANLISILKISSPGGIWKNICINFCGVTFKDCICYPAVNIEDDPKLIDPSNARMVITDGTSVDENSLKWIRENVEMSLIPIGLLPFFINTYNPLAEIGINNINTDNNLVTVNRDGRIINGVLNINSRINFPFENFINTNRKYGGATISNAKIDFRNQIIYLNQQGKFQSGELPISCSFLEPGKEYNLIRRSNDRFNIYNFEENSIQIPLRDREINECSEGFWKRIAIQYKLSNMSLLDFLTSSSLKKPDSICLKSNSKFLTYFQDCSSFNQDGQIAAYQKFRADMQPTTQTTFVLYYNAPITNPFNNLMCGSDKFDFNMGQINPTTQRCLELVGQGKSISLVISEEKKGKAKDIAYNRDGKTYYNILNLFDIPEEDKLENLAGISNNNPRIEIIDSKNPDSINLIKSV